MRETKPYNLRSRTESAREKPEGSIATRLDKEIQKGIDSIEKMAKQLEITETNPATPEGETSRTRATPGRETDVVETPMKFNLTKSPIHIDSTLPQSLQIVTVSDVHSHNYPFYFILHGLNELKQSHIFNEVKERIACFRDSRPSSNKALLYFGTPIFSTSTNTNIQRVTSQFSLWIKIIDRGTESDGRPLRNIAKSEYDVNLMQFWQDSCSFMACIQLLMCLQEKDKRIKDNQYLKLYFNVFNPQGKYDPMADDTYKKHRQILDAQYSNVVKKVITPWQDKRLKDVEAHVVKRDLNYGYAFAFLLSLMEGANIDFDMLKEDFDMLKEDFDTLNKQLNEIPESKTYTVIEVVSPDNLQAKDVINKLNQLRRSQTHVKLFGAVIDLLTNNNTGGHSVSCVCDDTKFKCFDSFAAQETFTHNFQSAIDLGYQKCPRFTCLFFNDTR